MQRRTAFWVYKQLICLMIFSTVKSEQSNTEQSGETSKQEAPTEMVVSIPTLPALTPTQQILTGTIEDKTEDKPVENNVPAPQEQIVDTNMNETPQNIQLSEIANRTIDLLNNSKDSSWKSFDEKTTNICREYKEKNKISVENFLNIVKQIPSQRNEFSPFKTIDESTEGKMSKLSFTELIESLYQSLICGDLVILEKSKSLFDSFKNYSWSEDKNQTIDFACIMDPVNKLHRAMHFEMKENRIPIELTNTFAKITKIKQRLNILVKNKEKVAAIPKNLVEIKNIEGRIGIMQFFEELSQQCALYKQDLTKISDTDFYNLLLKFAKKAIWLMFYFAPNPNDKANISTQEAETIKMLTKIYWTGEPSQDGGQNICSAKEFIMMLLTKLNNVNTTTKKKEFEKIKNTLPSAITATKKLFSELEILTEQDFAEVEKLLQPQTKAPEPEPTTEEPENKIPAFKSIGLFIKNQIQSFCTSTQGGWTALSNKILNINPQQSMVPLAVSLINDLKPDCLRAESYTFTNMETFNNRILLKNKEDLNNTSFFEHILGLKTNLFSATSADLKSLKTVLYKWLNFNKDPKTIKELTSLKDMLMKMELFDNPDAEFFVSYPSASMSYYINQSLEWTETLLSRIGLIEAFQKDQKQSSPKKSNFTEFKWRAILISVLERLVSQGNLYLDELDSLNAESLTKIIQDNGYLIETLLSQKRFSSSMMEQWEATIETTQTEIECMNFIIKNLWNGYAKENPTKNSARVFIKKLINLAEKLSKTNPELNPLQEFLTVPGQATTISSFVELLNNNFGLQIADQIQPVAAQKKPLAPNKTVQAKPAKNNSRR